MKFRFFFDTTISQDDIISESTRATHVNTHVCIHDIYIRGVRIKFRE